jgi:hypothetical protein
MNIASFKPIHKYTLNIGQCKGEYKLFFDFDPEGKNYAIPCRIVFSWGSVELDTGFRGEPEYNKDLIDLGYNQISSGSTNGFLTLFKNVEFPTTATLTVYTPIEESLVSVRLICPEECL